MRPEDRLAAVLAAEAAGQHTDYLFFWGHQPQRDGSTGLGCLSQWWPAPFTVEGMTYPSAEHWMMAGKAQLFRDDQALAAVLAAASPKAAKAAGRSVRGNGPIRPGRRRQPGQVPAPSRTRGLSCRHPAQGAGGGQPAGPDLGNRNDRQQPGRPYPSRWRGTNLLGFALMNVRDQL
jgi:predicted NAD-dependent protein-ADP-ribosyltransferase YbiA (DUF1768 family)